LLTQILDSLAELAPLPLVFPAHPRTLKNIESWGLKNKVPANLTMVKPMDYLSFIKHQQVAQVVITDSGGVTMGTNVLCLNPGDIPRLVREQIAKRPSGKPAIPMWDGNAGARIAKEIERLIK